MDVNPGPVPHWLCDPRQVTYLLCAITSSFLKQRQSHQERLCWFHEIMWVTVHTHTHTHTHTHIDIQCLGCSPIALQCKSIGRSELRSELKREESKAPEPLDGSEDGHTELALLSTLTSASSKQGDLQKACSSFLYGTCGTLGLPLSQHFVAQRCRNACAI